MLRRGFTIVELIIVIAIMGILLLLAVVNISSTQAQARDDERKADVEAIVSHMESYYKIGNSTTTTTGSYASTFTSSNTNAYIRTVLEDIDIKSLLAPGITDQNYKTFISATNNTQTIAGVTPLPDKDHYVYQPLQTSSALCTSIVQGCQKFNIYYLTEIDSVVHQITSKNQ